MGSFWFIVGIGLVLVVIASFHRMASAQEEKRQAKLRSEKEDRAAYRANFAKDVAKVKAQRSFESGGKNRGQSKSTGSSKSAKATSSASYADSSRRSGDSSVDTSWFSDTYYSGLSSGSSSYDSGSSSYDSGSSSCDSGGGSGGCD